VSRALAARFNPKGETIMANIGTFTRTTDGYTGTIKTLSLKAKVRLVPAKGSEGENAPDYRLIVGADTEIGAGWKKVGEKAGDYVSVVLDDPNFVQPIYANLIRSNPEEKSFVLLWRRTAKRERPVSE
jgi:uncharacterized protein (DUF736 family)